MKGGWNMFNLGARAGVALISAAAIASMFSQSTLAQAGKDPSDRVVRFLMNFAWQNTPPKFTSPNGKTIEVDKSKPKEVIVPLEVARAVVKIGRLSAHAQVCDLAEDQVANFRTMMRRKEKEGKWTDPQLLYIQRLHQSTVMLVTGKLVIDEKEEAKTNITQKCTDAQRDSVKKLIKAYRDEDTPPPAKTAEPAKTGAQKK